MSIKSLVDAYDQLDSFDLRVLRVIEIGHRRFEFVPLEVIVDWSKKSEELIDRSLKKLNALGMVIRYRGNYTGYRLTFMGYDSLALHTLAKRGILERVSPTPIGVGKESDVYAGDAVGDGKVVLKFHRLGRTSFRQIRRFRSWIGNRRHITWLYESRLSAHTEYKALVLAYNAGLNVPRPITVNRHTVVMSYINGVQLSEVGDVEDSEDLYWSIIENIKRLFADVGIVHGDLSEFNIMIDLDSGDPYIIDWPQWVPRNALGALDMLRRDIINITRYFMKKFKLGIDSNEVYNYVVGNVEVKEESLEKALEELLGNEGLSELMGSEKEEEFEDT
ncbi:RIO-like serine/threonine protein kinase fused to N-terminal HTH domain [Vulcanisaeta moutnovskia 768-28]|uniref:non-specific serine/threonine protein kinase n=1 Tax=Vulcanisaeta moutnovskia (strain 768-28) TaxID=985053 RepID=F0QXC9_VULM7|nr:RIO1 family regulatory kinase/ATPase [Vulcanisaeta moutnovskia]ADY01168.1 RIO-like serine/threonine protein kinase fused to N-terminal HTH domain [Vulcanisaeta moutnovskia 768-28]